MKMNLHVILLLFYYYHYYYCMDTDKVWALRLWRIWRYKNLSKNLNKDSIYAWLIIRLKCHGVGRNIVIKKQEKDRAKKRENDNVFCLHIIWSSIIIYVSLIINMMIWHIVFDGVVKINVEIINYNYNYNYNYNKIHEHVSSFFSITSLERISLNYNKLYWIGICWFW